VQEANVEKSLRGTQNPCPFWRRTQRVNTVIRDHGN
jgi:hypothetical protein